MPVFMKGSLKLINKLNLQPEILRYVQHLFRMYSSYLLNGFYFNYYFILNN